MNTMKKLLISITTGLFLQQSALAVPPLETAEKQQNSEVKQCDSHKKTSLLEVKQAYVKQPIPGVSVTSAYMNITNTSDKVITLKNVSSNVSKFTELHDSVIKNDKMIMRQIKSLNIAPQQTVTFEPGAQHIMLMGLTQKLKEGEKVTINFNLEGHKEAQKITVPVMKDAYICPHSGKLMSGDSHE